MSSAVVQAQTEKHSGLTARILDRERRIDYVLMFAVGVLPIAVARFAGVHCMDGDCLTQNGIGYWQSPNWWSLAVLLPAVLYAVRLFMGTIAPIGGSWPPAKLPPIVNLVVGDAARRAVYDGLRRSMLAPRNAAAAFVITVLIHLADAPTLLAPYYAELFKPGSFAAATIEPSWTYGFLRDPGVSIEMNFLLFVLALCAQFTAVLLGILSIVLILRHNWFFLRNVYQRRWVPEGEEARFFQINPKDVNRCFGFRAANESFNAQILALMFAGAAMFASRVAHSPERDSLVEGLWRGEFELSFPLPTQWLMALSWLGGLFIVALPALVKMLPRLPGGGTERMDHSVAVYLREFFSARSWPKDKRGRDLPVDRVAARFARNAFWPTGDNRAAVLFFFAYLVFLVTLMPPPLVRPEVLALDLLVFGVIAYLLQRLTFVVFERSLRYVDDLLVDGSAAKSEDEYDDGLPGDDPGRDKGVFISYRRSDSGPYVRALHERLIGAFQAQRVFMDVEDIGAGENFVQRIDKALEDVDVVLAVIGKDWLTTREGDSRRRIDEPGDMVRIELETALRHEKRVVPVTVGGASMPAAADLPGALRNLSEINAAELSDTRWSEDVDRLIETIRKD